MIELLCGGFGFGLCAFGRLLGVADFLIQQIDLLLHDLVAVLQRRDEGLLSGELLFERVVLSSEG